MDGKLFSPKFSQMDSFLQNISKSDPSMKLYKKKLGLRMTSPFFCEFQGEGILRFFVR